MAPLHHVGAPLLLLNASVVVLLNLSTMALIKHTSALTLNVSGVFKDIGAPRHSRHSRTPAQGRPRPLTPAHAFSRPRRRRRVLQA